jgi:glucan 1,3-beta-glucosidase
MTHGNRRLQRAAISAAVILLVPLLSRCLPKGEPSPAPPALPPLHASGATIVDDKERPVVLHGCNLGNWLLNEMWMMDMAHNGEPGDQWEMEELLKQRFGAQEKDRLLDVFRENWIRPRDYDIIKSWGFNVVRLPFNYTLLEDDASGVLRSDAFQWLDRAVDMARHAGLYVILDMHGAPGRQSTDHCTGRSGQNQLWLPKNRERTAFLWKKIAEHYRTSTTVAAYDLLNEPFGDYRHEPSDSAIVATMDQLIHAIREVDQQHLICCAGSMRGIAMYGSPASRGWRNIGYTEHFYPGVYDNSPTLETHARFLSRDLRARADLFKQWRVPFLAGEFNVVFERAGGSTMMRRYYDTFASYGWMATLWSYKLVKHDGGCHPDNWYLVTNRDELAVPALRTASKDEIEEFFKTLGTMSCAQDDELRVALTSSKAPALVLHEYPVIPGPAPQDHPPEGWDSHDLGEPFLKGGQRVIAEDGMEVFGGGCDVFEGADECHFISRQAGGHFDLGTSLTPPFDAHIYAKAGLMYRTSLDADAPIVMVSLFPDGTCTFAFRRQAGARITEIRLPPPGKTRALRLVRNGAHFEASALDADGKPFATKSADLPELESTKGFLGLFVLSHQPLLLSKATFTNIQIHQP